MLLQSNARKPPPKGHLHILENSFSRPLVHTEPQPTFAKAGVATPNRTRIGVWERSPSPKWKNRPVSSSHVALKPEDGAVLTKLRPQNAGFKQN